MNRIAVVFDLDDTLYKERDFVESGKEFVASYLCKLYSNSIFKSFITLPAREFFDRAVKVTKSVSPDNPMDISDLLSLYRNHRPSITLSDEVRDLLKALHNEPSVILALITDGRSVTQWNKIISLGLREFIPEQNILISEEIGGDKLSGIPYSRLHDTLGDIRRWIYIGDNPAKDFVFPNKSGDITVMIADKDNINIHSQELSDNQTFNPKYTVSDFKELGRILGMIINENIKS